MKSAVILSGCGHMDGAEIRESVISLLELSKNGIEFKIFAPDKPQIGTINHISGKPMLETRNVMIEAARIARGEVTDLALLNPDEFDMLVIPGGFGVAKNLSNLAEKGAAATIDPLFLKALEGFIRANKPIGVICIAPAVVAVALGEKYHPSVTIGEDAGTASEIEKAGGRHIICTSDEIAIDEKNNIVSCSAYMRNDELWRIAKGIEKMVEQLAVIARRNIAGTKAA